MFEVRVDTLSYEGKGVYLFLVEVRFDRLSDGDKS